MFKSLLIYQDNNPLKNMVHFSEKFNIESFDFGNSDLDTYISQKLIPKIAEKDFNIMFIKDNLSDNYLELYGITLAYHIRLSSELGNKRFVPIVILSDVDGYILNKLTPIANILFTKNTFVARNEIASYSYFEKVFEQIKLFSDFKKEFLDLIHIDPPQDYLSHHDIANEWSIYRWAEFLHVDTNATKANKAKIENMLYFKYLKAKYHLEDTKKLPAIQKPTKEGKVLLIDDEWDKGWSDIIHKAISKDGIDFKTFEYIFKDKIYEDIIDLIKSKINSFNPDVVILDLRLLESDHDEEKQIDEFSGIKLLKEIHKINAGIQVIMLTATSKSTILEKLYEYKILGYIKKEHPEDFSINTIENINKFINLIDIGLKNNYLKYIYSSEKKIMSLLLFEKQKFNEKQQNSIDELKREIYNVAAVLDSNVERNFTFGMLTIYKLIETINMIYIKEETISTKPTTIKAFWINNNNMIVTNEDKRNNRDGGITSTEYKFKCILEKFSLLDKKTRDLLSEIKNFRNCEIHPESDAYDHEKYGSSKITPKKLQEWFKFVCSVIENINRNPQIPTEGEFNKEQKNIQNKQEEKEISKEIQQKTQGVKNDLHKKDHGLRNDGFSDLEKLKKHL